MKCCFVLLVLLTAAAARAETLGDYTSHHVLNGSLIVRAGTPLVVITPYTESVVRVSVFPDGVVRPDSSPVVVLEPEAGPPLVTDLDTLLLAQCGAVEITVQKYPLRLRIRIDGRPVLEDESGFYWQAEQRGVRMRLNAGEHFYGGGERANGLDQRGNLLDSYNAPHYCYGMGEINLNITVPFLLSSAGYGLYFEDSYPATMDIGHTAADILDYRAGGGDLSYFILGRSRMRDGLADYAALTGKPSLLPRWALGYMQSRFGYQSETEARTVVDAFRAQDIPLDALILDLYWFGWGQMGDFDWDNSQWPNPAGMMRDFDSVGVKTILITEPYIVTSSSNYGPVREAGYLTHDGAGNPYLLPNFWFGPAGLLDITNPAAAEWLWERYAALVEQGVGGWWSDLGEPEAHPSDMQHYAGPAARVHNIFSLEWAKLMQRKYDEHYPQRRLFNLFRSGYAGMPHYSAVPWSGDVQRSFGGLQAQLPILLGMGLSGVPWTGSDAGGFDCGAADAELYIRWMQFAAFSPLMRAHGVNVVTEPVYMDSTARAIVRDYIRLRYAFLPYNYTLMWEAHRSGLPMARAVCLDDGDERAAALHDEYLWGDQLLVAPVMSEGAVSRPVYLPPGRWIDYWSDAAYSGPQTMTASGPLDRIPLFVRAGGILPSVPVVNSTARYRSDTLLFDYYADDAVPSSLYMLYEDDGRTANAYDAGLFETVTLNAELGESGLSLIYQRNNSGYPGAPGVRRIVQKIHRVSAPPTAVSFAGYSLPVAATLSEALGADSAVYYDGGRHCMYATFHWAGLTAALLAEPLQVLQAAPRATTVRELRLAPNYPNPFNGGTQIRLEVPTARPIRLEIYDLLGRVVATLIDGQVAGGEHRVYFDATGLASGLYFCRLSDDHSVAMQKLILLK